MPIRIDEELPAKQSLELENVFVMSNKRADTQDIRPLNIIILNLMPTKVVTETQLLRLLSNSPLQVDVDLLQVATHKTKNTSKEHMLKFYKTFDEVKNNKYDGMIITGAPLANFKFEDVDFWEELCTIFEWTKTNVYSTMFLCWGAFAALYYKYGIKPIDLPEKRFGIYPHISLDIDIPSDGTEAFFERLSLMQAMDSLSEQERKLIEYRYFKGKTQCETAELLGVSQVQISRKEKAVLKKLRERL